MGFVKDVRDSTKSLVEGVRVIGDLARSVSDLQKSLTSEGGPLGLGILPLIAGTAERPTPKPVEKVVKVRQQVSVRKVKRRVAEAVADDPNPLTPDERDLMEIWLEKQKEKGKDTMATRFAERRLGKR